MAETKGKAAEIAAAAEANRLRAKELFDNSVASETGGAITGLPKADRPAAMSALAEQAEANIAARAQQRAATERNNPPEDPPPPKKRITMHEAEEGNQ